MKKRAILIVLAVFLSSCSSTENIDIQQTSANASVTDEITKALIPEQELVYTNEEGGYQITFPESWRGYYVITERGSEICVGFYGKSKTGQIGEKHSNGRYGLDMFWIVTEPPPDKVGPKIGEINGVEYFYGRWGGIPSNIFTEILNPDGWARGYYGEIWEIDEAELALIEQDNEKLVQIIQEDLWNAEEGFLQTFMTLT